MVGLVREDEAEVGASVDRSEHGGGGAYAYAVKHEPVHLRKDETAGDQRRLALDGSLKEGHRRAVLPVPPTEKGEPGAAIDEQALVIVGGPGATRGVSSQRRSPRGSDRSGCSGP